MEKLTKAQGALLDLIHSGAKLYRRPRRARLMYGGPQYYIGGDASIRINPATVEILLSRNLLVAGSGDADSAQIFLSSRGKARVASAR